MSITYIPLPQPKELTSREKEDAMGAYLMMFAAFAVSIPLPIVNLIAAIIYFYINRKKAVIFIFIAFNHYCHNCQQPI